MAAGDGEGASLAACRARAAVLNAATPPADAPLLQLLLDPPTFLPARLLPPLITAAAPSIAGDDDDADADFAR